MAISEQFAGLDMKNLIGAPLTAAADASVQLANSTAEFINKVGFDDSGKVRTASFGYQKHSVNEDGTSNLDEMKVDVPMLAIVPIPNLQVDEVNVLFDMEVKQTESSRESTDVSASVSGSARILFIKAKFSCSVSSHKEHTRSSDNSAKYHVDVRATNHGMPEGLARVLDMMAANVAPALVGSTIKDENGQDLAADAKARAEKKKQIRQEVMQLENRLDAARQIFDNSVAQFVKIAEIQQNKYQADVAELLNGLGDSEEDNQKAEKYGDIIAEVNQSWNNLKNQAGDLIKIIADSAVDKDGTPQKLGKVSDVLALEAFKKDNSEKVEPYGDGETQYQAMLAAQNKAVKAQRDVSKIEDDLMNKKLDYNKAIAGIEVTKKENNSSQSS